MSLARISQQPSSVGRHRVLALETEDELAQMGLPAETLLLDGVPGKLRVFGPQRASWKMMPSV